MSYWVLYWVLWRLFPPSVQKNNLSGIDRKGHIIPNGKNILDFAEYIVVGIHKVSGFRTHEVSGRACAGEACLAPTADVVLGWLGGLLVYAFACDQGVVFAQKTLEKLCAPFAVLRDALALHGTKTAHPIREFGNRHRQ